MRPVDKWISVKDQMPPTDGTMFAVWDDVHGFIPFVYADEDRDVISETYQWSGNFSYWMPLPEPPNGAQSDKFITCESCGASYSAEHQAKYPHICLGEHD